MPRKVFNVTVEFDLHAVSCPGVWLCPKGKVSLRVAMLDSSAETCDLEPAFPLLVRETFTFAHTFRRVRYLQDLAHLLSGQLLSIQMIQWGSSLASGNILATFDTSLEELLYPAPRCRALLAGVDVDLLMEPTDVFPGIIAPKLEVSTRTTIEEAVTSSVCGDGSSVFSKTILSKTAGAQNKRQRKVCHSRATKLPGSPRKVPGSPRKLTGRLRAQSCLVQRKHAARRESTASAWRSDGDESSSGLSPIQRLVWRATSRDLRGPLAETDLGRAPRRCGCTNLQSAESLKAETGLGSRCTNCHSETLLKAGTASVRVPRPNESSSYLSTGALGSESRLNQTCGNRGLRCGLPMENETLRSEAKLSASAFDREAKNVKSRAKPRGSPPTNATRHNVTPASTCDARASARSRPLRDGLRSDSSSPSPQHSSCEPRRKFCVACAMEESSRRGGFSCAGPWRRQGGRCCAGDGCACAGKYSACACAGKDSACACAGKDSACACAGKDSACACAGKPVPSIRRLGDPSASMRTALRSNRGSPDISYRESFYRNLEKFYKRLYDQALERRNASCGC